MFLQKVKKKKKFKTKKRTLRQKKEGELYVLF